MLLPDTIVALSSGRLPSGVAVIRASGPQVRFGLETIFGSVPEPRRAAYGRFRDQEGEVVDTGLALFFPQPRSFTGEDVAEFQVHGSKAIVAKLLNTLTALPSVRLAEAGEFTRRALANGRTGLLEVEATADLLAAETEAQRRFAVGNATGAHQALYSRWRAELTHARAMIEAELDFSDEGDVPGSVSDEVWRHIDSLSVELQAHASGYRRAEIIRDGFDVVLLGAPNAGKSSLLNALAQRDVAIVSDEPGTTRDLIDVVLDLDGMKVKLTDTAGLRHPQGTVEAIGIERALARAQRAHLVLVLEDASLPKQADVPFYGTGLRIGTKSDLLHGYAPSSGYDMTISAHTGAGIHGLLSVITDFARAGAANAGEMLPWRQRHVDLLGEAANDLELAMSADHPIEIRADRLRLAADSLGRIVGAIDVEDLLGAIFREFCIGK